MEVQTTVRNFAHDMTAYRISPDTRIRVVIDETHLCSPHSASPEPIIIPSLTPLEQRQLLNNLPHSYDPEASEELIAIIDSSHMNTEQIEI